MTHTPGPWRIQPNPQASICVETGDGDYYICELACGQQSHANARLIAAAPDLLAACEDIEKNLAMSAVMDRYASGLLKQLRAAIAKAEPEVKP